MIFLATVMLGPFAESAWLGSPNNGYSLIYRVSKSQTIIFRFETFYDAIIGLCQQFPLYGTLKREREEAWEKLHKVLQCILFFDFIALRKFLLIVIEHFAEFTLLLEAFLGLESRFFSAFVIWKLKQFRLRGAEYTKSCFPDCFSWHILWNPNLHVKG